MLSCAAWGETSIICTDLARKKEVFKGMHETAKKTFNSHLGPPRNFSCKIANLDPTFSLSFLRVFDAAIFKSNSGVPIKCYLRNSRHFIF